MKNPIIVILLFISNIVSSSLNLSAQEVPFSRGINLTNWFQVNSAQDIQFSQYTKKDFEQIKSLGCDVIRLPINLHSMTTGSPDYTIDPLFYSFLDQVVNWAEEVGIHVILDNHTFDPAVNTDPSVGPVLLKVWSQMAGHYKSSSPYILYEVLNEPHGISDQNWNAIQAQVISSIRESDTTHYIVIGGAGWNSYNNLNAMPVYDDSKLIYTFHFYDPFIFTHQGASWVDPSMVPLRDVPFPYMADSMPPLPASLQGTWVGSAFNDYSSTGNVASMKSLLDVAIQFKNTRHVPVYCGEFGVYIPNSHNNHRVAWYEAVRKYLEENGIPWTTWDYHGGFGLFKGGSAGMFEHDLNVPLLNALGLNVPEQTTYTQKPDSTGFMIFTDYPGDHINVSDYTQGTLHHYSSEDPNNGAYCIYWNGANQYNTIGFDFSPDKDLAELRQNGFALDLMVRGNSSQISFDVRFLDTKKSIPDDHPWRMRMTVDESKTDFDGHWHHLFIPLSTFTEQGSWDNEWFSPEGKFDWTAIDRFEIVSEQKALTGMSLWFDNIHVTDQDTSRVFEEVITDLKTALSNTFRIYPNPTHDYVYLEFSSNMPARIQIKDMTGHVYMSELYFPGEKLDVSHLTAGMYFIYGFDEDKLIGVAKLVTD